MEQKKWWKNKNTVIAVGSVIALLVLAGVTALFLTKPWEIRLTEVYAVSVSREDNTVAVGEAVSLDLLFTPLNEKQAQRAEEKLGETVFVWSSSDETVASVDEDGRVTGVGPGTAMIHVCGGGLSATGKVTVYRKLEGVTLSETELIGNVGDSVKLAYELNPSDAGMVGETRWSVVDPNIAEVMDDGTVTMKNPGTTEVYLGIGEFTAKCTVAVKAPLEKIELNKGSLGLSDGGSTRLTVSVYPENTTDDTTVSWRSSDVTVAAVDEDGRVTAIEPGEAVIYAKVGDFEVSCEVKVTAPMTAFSIRVSELTLRYGDATTLPVVIEPVNTTDDQEIIWSSSDETVVEVDSSGTVTALNAGTAVVRAVCGGFVSECRITVIIPVDSVLISRTQAALNKGEQITLTAAVNPTNTTEDRSISWTSDNATVITVKNGVVTAVGPGTARIIASHGDYYAVCVVTVYSPMTGIEFEQDTLSVIEGYSGNLSVLFLPTDTTDAKRVSWTSSDEEIATVNQDGKVQGISAGTCEITASCGEFVAVCEVTVQPYIEVEEIVIDMTEYDFSEIGETLQLTAAVTPDDASFSLVSFSSSDSTVATVSADGLVRAVGEGTAVITATAGGKSARCTVTVPKPDIIVVLDPGHGGKHAGASYYGYREQDLTLKVAQYCRQYLEENYIGVKVYMTREGDTHLKYNLSEDLEARAQFAQDKGATILVSLHFNAHAWHNQNGCEIIVSHRSNVSAQCSALGNSILNQLAALGIRNRGLKKDYSTDYFDEYGNPLDGYAINRHCANRGIPGIIVEHCFMDSQSDLVFFNSEGALQKLGIADAIGIANYLGLEKK